MEMLTKVMLLNKVLEWSCNFYFKAKSIMPVLDSCSSHLAADWCMYLIGALTEIGLLSWKCNWVALLLTLSPFYVAIYLSKLFNFDTNSVPYSSFYNKTNFTMLQWQCIALKLYNISTVFLLNKNLYNWTKTTFMYSHCS